MQDIIYKAKIDFLGKLTKCECGGELRDIFTIKKSGPMKKLVVKDVELTP